MVTSVNVGWVVTALVAAALAEAAVLVEKTGVRRGRESEGGTATRKPAHLSVRSSTASGRKYKKHLGLHIKTKTTTKFSLIAVGEAHHHLSDM